MTMTGIAQLSPPANGTKLYLNFDGNSDAHVSPFESTTGNRNQDIQEILFRTSEMFAPFDVEVYRISGNGAQAYSGGHTTIFIGDKLGNSNFYDEPAGQTVINSTRAYAQIDYPSPSRGFNHVPNSDPYNVGYVDPIGWLSSSANGWAIEDLNQWDNYKIARAVAHEAGHTYGLAHVLTGGTAEVMSYDAINTRFKNQTFDVTTLNNGADGVAPAPSLQPMWYYLHPTGAGPYAVVPTLVNLQNSYTYLQAALGSRPTDLANVAHSGNVDAAYVDGWQTSLDVGEYTIGTIGRHGDYDVFDFSPAGNQWVRVEADEMYSDDVDLVVMIYDGQQLVAFDDDGGGGTDSTVIFHAQAGKDYKIVVGSWNGQDLGNYELTLGLHEFEVNPVVGDGPGGFQGTTRNTGPFAVQGLYVPLTQSSQILGSTKTQDSQTMELASAQQTDDPFAYDLDEELLSRSSLESLTSNKGEDSDLEELAFWIGEADREASDSLASRR